MPWDKKLPSRQSLKVVWFYRFPEYDLIGGLYAEDHHVVKVSAYFFNFVFGGRFIFSENTARWEDVFNSVNDNAERWKRKVASVILHVLVACNKDLSNDLQ